jgi:hypothetical protein
LIVVAAAAAGVQDCRVNLGRDEVQGGMRVVTLQHESSEVMLRAKAMVLERAAQSTSTRVAPAEPV